MASERPSKKRKRGKNNTKTCVRCRQRHEKCDGGNPCAFCLKTGSECVYVAPKKRGPRPGYRKKYVTKIAELEATIKQQQEELRQYRYANPIAPTTKQVVCYSISPSNVGVRMANANLVLSYLDSVRKLDAGFMIPLDINRVSHTQISSDSYHLYAAAAFGAFVCGNQVHYNQLDNIAKSIETQLGSQLHPKIAAGNSLQAVTYFFNGEMVDAMAYTKKAKKHVTMWATSNKGVITRKERTLIHVITWHEAKFLRGLLRINAIDEICRELLTFSEGVPKSLGHTDQALLAVCLVSQVMHKISLANIFNKTLTASEKTNCLLRLMQTDLLNIEPLGAHLQVLVLVAKSKYQLSEGNRGRAHQLASVALKHLNAIPPNALVRVLLGIRLLEIFAVIEAPNDFVHCFNILKDLSKRWKIGKLICNLILSIVNMKESDPHPPAIIPTILPQSGIMLLQIKEVASMLKKLTLSGYNIFEDVPSTQDDEEDTLGSDQAPVVRETLSVPQQQSTVTSPLQPVESTPQQPPMVESAPQQQPVVGSAPQQQRVTNVARKRSVMASTPQQQPVARTPPTKDKYPHLFQANPKITAALPPNFRFTKEHQQRMKMLNCLVNSNRSLANFILTKEQKRKLTSMGGLDNMLKMLKQQELEDQNRATNQEDSAQPSGSTAPSPMQPRTPLQTPQPSVTPLQTPVAPNSPLQTSLPAHTVLQAPSAVPSAMPHAQNAPFSMQAHYSPPSQLHSGGNADLSQVQGGIPLAPQVSNSGSFSSHQQEEHDMSLLSLSDDVPSSLTPQPGFETVPLHSGLDSMEWQQSLFPGAMQTDGINTDWEL